MLKDVEVRSPKRDIYTGRELDPKWNPNAHHLISEIERDERHMALLARANTAVTRDDHIQAATELLAAVNPHGMYVKTPLYVEIAQVHADIARGMKEGE